MSNNAAREKYIQDRTSHWNSVATKERSNWSRYYHRYLERVYKHNVPQHLRVLEIGCGKGNLLAALNPTEGLGIDQSEVMIRSAKKNHPSLQFLCGTAEDVQFDGVFDVIILSDLLNNVWDVQELLAKLWPHCTETTRIIINSYSKLWQPALNVVRKLGMATPMLPQNWLTVEDIQNLLYLEGYDTIQSSTEFIFPFDIPLISSLANRFLAKIVPFKWLCLANVLIARPSFNKESVRTKPVVSVIVAARNEEGHIEDIIRRTPEMGAGTELIFVEGGSIDNTFDAINREIAKNPEKNISVWQQTGKGKGDAVRLGFRKAKGDILMILDADMTVPPENLPLFYEALVSGKGEFINGVRLVYPMEQEAMRFFNLLGNKFFSLAFSWLLGQSIKDTLCGTKVMTKEHYMEIAANRSYFGDFDPFGDFDLIFGAAKLNLKIVDLPIRYRDRHYGETNISRWKHGVILLRMVAFAALKIKFY